MPFSQDKLDAFLKAKKTGANQNRIGGKGTARRKKKVQRKTTTQDDKRLKSTLQKLNVRDITAIEEVNMFKDDGTVVHFQAPKVQASIASNTYVIMGPSETKKLQDLLPRIASQLGPENLAELQKLYKDMPGMGGLLGGEEEDDDDDVPELVGNFEDVAAGAGGAAEEDSEGSEDDEDSDDEPPELVES